MPFWHAVSESLRLAWTGARSFASVLLAYFLFYAIFANKIIAASMSDNGNNQSVAYYISWFVDILFFMLAFLQLDQICQDKKNIKNNADLLLAAFKKLPHFMIAFVFFVLCGGVGFLLFILPGVYLSGIAYIYFAVIILKNMSIWAGFKYSARLVWGHWWWAMGLYVAPWIFGFGATLIGFLGTEKFLPLFHLGDSPLRNVLYALCFVLNAYLTVAVSVVALKFLQEETIKK